MRVQEKLAKVLPSRAFATKARDIKLQMPTLCRRTKEPLENSSAIEKTASQYRDAVRISAVNSMSFF